jgi:hypothetical protein
MPGLGLSQIYLHDSSLTTHNRNLAPPFHVETGINVRARRRSDGAVEVWATYITDVSTQDRQDGDIPVWTVSLRIVARYERLDDGEPAEGEPFTRDDLEAFALLVGAPAIHPYAREWTQTLSSHSQYPALTMGLMQSIAELPEDQTIDLVAADAEDLPG